MNQSRVPIQAITFEETDSGNIADRRIIDHTHYVYPHKSSLPDTETRDESITIIETQSELLSNHLFTAQKRTNELLTKLIEQSK